jgi:hypothetical protein
MNYKLILNILTTINGGLVTGAALFNPLIGQDMALKVISALGICQIIVSGINSNLTTQTNIIKDVASITGDDGKPALRINVNANAPQNVAAVAIDPAQPNVGASSPEVRSTLVATAKGA